MNDLVPVLVRYTNCVACVRTRVDANDIGDERYEEDDSPYFDSEAEDFRFDFDFDEIAEQPLHENRAKPAARLDVEEQAEANWMSAAFFRRHRERVYCMMSHAKRWRRLRAGTVKRGGRNGRKQKRFNRESIRTAA
ncbi:MAG TPA: hypothetical protein VN397_02495 [Candidatus Methylomirabilis sp.]|nr:hypothetical protein [Candidatus Methylomirabilis sp.]